MPEGILDLRQFLIYLARNSNDYLRSEIETVLSNSYNETTSFYRKMMRFFEDKSMMDGENHKVPNIAQKNHMRYWTTTF
jgi:hypothetical protein